MKSCLKLTFVMVFAALSVFSASALEAKFVSTSGKVEIFEGGMWVAVKNGDIIEDKGAVVSTGFKSEAVISVKGTNFTLGPLTRITIEDMTAMENKDSTKIYIDSGSLKASVSPSEGRKVGFKVRSAVATASVRGTEFKITSSGRLSVTEGLVSFGAPEASSAEVSQKKEESSGLQENDIAESESETAGTEADIVKEKSTTFTASSEVGDKGGVPVFAGQTSQSDPTSFAPTSPYNEKSNSADTNRFASDSMGMNSINTIASAAPIPGAKTGAGNTPGSIAIAISWGD
ncbi:FecR family protein [Treponema sp.]|uniref:FecR family protein n=1 Tax=Treponema sp. TaxID=166 RepID=UPI003EFC3D9E